MNLGTIALWWCYVTGGAIALALTAIALTWALDRVMVMTGNYKILLEWYWDRCKTRRGRVTTKKTTMKPSSDSQGIALDTPPPANLS